MAPPDAQPARPAPAAQPAGTLTGRRRWWAAPLIAVMAVLCLLAAVVVGRRADAELTRKPTSAELYAAAALGVASRWQRWPAGQIFPAQLSYATDLLNEETAERVGIAPGYGCAAALDTAQTALARRFGCRAALRATYVDQLGGIVYTLGVLAFPCARASAGFYSRYTASQVPVRGLHALAFPGTAAAAFTDPARQAATSSLDGPFVVLSVAGYGDGRPAAATGERRASVFAPAIQLATDVSVPLDQPVTVRCGTPEWSC